MTRTQLEHVVRAAATIAGDPEIVIGSQAILGRYPEAPSELLVSKDADVYPRNHPDRADLIEGSIGELSPFHETFGFISKYAAGREKDREYVRVVSRHGLAERAILLARLEQTPIDEARRAVLKGQIETDFAER